jgi:hypothetical protein
MLNPAFSKSIIFLTFLMSSVLASAKDPPTKIDIQRKGDHFEITTPAWILKSWISRSQTLACAKRIEIVRKNLAAIFKENSVQKNHLEILIFKDQRSFSEYTKEDLDEVYYAGGYWSYLTNWLIILLIALFLKFLCG